MIGYYNYTVVLTYIGLLTSFVGISYAMDGELKGAVICLMICGICDMFDGKIARTRKRTELEKRFGIQIDSLSDLICFGILPIVIGHQIDSKNYLSYIVFGVYLLATLIRLAYFNVQEEERQKGSSECRRSYQGLPVTTVALIVPLIYCSYLFHKIEIPFLYTISLGIIAICFLLPVHIKKPHIIGQVGMVFVGLVEFLLLIIGGKI